MGRYYEWKKKYCTGDTTIDAQHQYLFKLANKLQDTSALKCKPFIINLYKYTKVHFKAEEELMAKSKYPAIEHHKLLHENLTISLNDLSDQYAESVESRDYLVAIFGNWIINHILNEDLRFSNFMTYLKD